jgi:hypothetical protein
MVISFYSNRECKKKSIRQNLDLLLYKLLVLFEFNVHL